MNRYQIYLGLTLGLMISIADHIATLVLDNRLVEIFLLILVAFMSVIAIFFGVRLSLIFRTALTTLIFTLGIHAALFGRTDFSSTTWESIQAALFIFFYIGSISMIPLFRIWKGRIKIIILVFYPIACVVTALTIAIIEERIFVYVYEDSNDFVRKERWSTSGAYLVWANDKGDTKGYLSGYN